MIALTLYSRPGCHLCVEMKAVVERVVRELETAVQPSHEVQDEICGCLAGVVRDLKPEYAEVIQAVLKPAK